MDLLASEAGLHGWSVYSLEILYLVVITNVILETNLLKP
jgi:hypothetical protein